MRKIAVGLMMILMLAAFGAGTADAAATATIDVTVTITAGALDVSLNQTSWAIGSIAESATPDTVAGTIFTATNSRNASETLTLTVAGSANWAAGTEAAANQFAMQYSTNDGGLWTSILSGGSSLGSVASGASKAFDLKLLAPTTTTVGGTQQSIVVTITAS